MDLEVIERDLFRLGLEGAAQAQQEKADVNAAHGADFVFSLPALLQDLVHVVGMEIDPPTPVAMSMLEDPVERTLAGDLGVAFGQEAGAERERLARGRAHAPTLGEGVEAGDTEGNLGEMKGHTTDVGGVNH